MDHARVAKDVLTYVGGADNINAAAHCATRLRLVLKDMDKVDQKALDKDPDLKGTFIAGGMFQIIVGPGDVDLVFSEMIRTGGVKEVSKDEAKEQAAKGGNPLSRFIKTIADIFVPMLPALIAGGLMMALHNVLTADFFTGPSFVTSDNPTGAYGLVDRFSWLADYDDVINLVSSAAFAFLPVLVGFSAVKRFGGNVYLGAAMGAAMVSTSLLSAYSMSDPEAAATNTFGAGFTYNYDKRLTVGLDYSLQQWSKTKFDVNTSDEAVREDFNETYTYCDRHKISVGAEYIPNLMGRSYLSHIKYRLGAYYTTPYYQSGGKELPVNMA